MEKVKYEVMKDAILNCLKGNGESTHAEMLQAITGDFKKNNISFAGNVEWHMEWVKLDLEAGKLITRVENKSPIKFKLYEL